MRYILIKTKFKLSKNRKHQLILKNYKYSDILLIIITNLLKITLNKRYFLLKSIPKI